MVIRKEKPNSAEETARVLRIFDMLCEQLSVRYPKIAFMVVADGNGLPEMNNIPAMLEIADSIARRTEDD